MRGLFSCWTSAIKPLNRAAATLFALDRSGQLYVDRNHQPRALRRCEAPSARSHHRLRFHCKSCGRPVLFGIRRAVRRRCRRRPGAGRDREGTGSGFRAHGGCRRCRQRGSRRRRSTDIVLRGYFVSVDEGSAGERLLIGFGAGAAELRTAVEAYQMTDQGLRQFGRGEIRSGGGKMPGVVVPLAVVAATANPIGLIVGGGSRRPAKRPARPPSKAQADARRTQFRRNCASRRAARLDLAE